MADITGQFEVDGLVKQRKELEQMLSSNPDMEKRLQKLIRKVLMQARKFIMDGIKFDHGDPRQARKAVKMLRESGYHNISLDLMYGLPGQTMEMWQSDVDELLSMRVPHLSAYSLQWEEGTPLYRMLEMGKVNEAPEELSVEMYRYLVETTRLAGMEHYEISNFALPGMRARHNSGYWRNEAYVGLGPGAHSYDGGAKRSSNPPDLLGYIRSAGLPQQELEILDEDALYEEYVLKSLRTMDGMDIGLLAPKYREYALKMVLPHILAGRVERHGDVLRLTEEGIFVSNDVMSDMML